MTARLVRPVVAVERGTRGAAVTLPIGAEVNFNPNASTVGLVDILVYGKWHLAYLEDVLSALIPGDALWE